MIGWYDSLLTTLTTNTVNGTALHDEPCLLVLLQQLTGYTQAVTSCRAAHHVHCHGQADSGSHQKLLAATANRWGPGCLTRHCKQVFHSYMSCRSLDPMHAVAHEPNSCKSIPFAARAHQQCPQDVVRPVHPAFHHLVPSPNNAYAHLQSITNLQRARDCDNAQW